MLHALVMVDITTMLAPQNIVCQIHLILYINNKKEKQTEKSCGVEPNPNLSRAPCYDFISPSFCFFYQELLLFIFYFQATSLNKSNTQVYGV